MKTRQATINDIPEIQRVRHLVKENILSDPALVPDSDVADYINIRGRGWVCEIHNQVTGFSIISVDDKNVWALFVDPEFEKMGVGRLLHDQMMDWYFEQTSETAWLGTAPNTRAEQFYRKAGWVETGMHGKGEIKFEMTAENWLNRI